MWKVLRPNQWGEAGELTFVTGPPTAAGGIARTRHMRSRSAHHVLLPVVITADGLRTTCPAAFINKTKQREEPEDNSPLSSS